MNVIGSAHTDNTGMGTELGEGTGVKVITNANDRTENGECGLGFFSTC